MTPGVRPLVAGNWKMNGLSASLAEIKAMREAVDAGKAGAAVSRFGFSVVLEGSCVIELVSILFFP